MSIDKCKDFIKDGYGTWDDSSKPTTFANMYDFMENQNNVTLALANSLWQPSTAYVVGAVIHSPSLPAGCKATCTTEGTTGSTEPGWTAYGTSITDGTVTWKIETDVQSTLMTEVTAAINQTAQNCSDLYAKAQTTILNQYVLTSLQGVNDVTKYNQIRNFYFLTRGADKLNGTTTDADAATLTGIVS